MNIYITLDYELYLGKHTGSADNCLFRPMKALMDMLDNTGTKITVFVDGAYLYRMDELKEDFSVVAKELSDVISNIKEISRRGHSIQYHFHPQWLYSDYEEGKGWNMDFDHYKLSDVPLKQLSAAFKKGMQLIENTTGKKMISFRAGGYSLCSYEWYGKMFNDNGIKIDSSVQPGMRINSRFQVYDYIKVPSEDIYQFKYDIKKKEKKSNDTFTEIPISYMNGPLWVNYFLSLKKKVLQIYKPTILYGDGEPVNTVESKLSKISHLMKLLFKRYRITTSIDSIGPVLLEKVYEYRKAKGYQNLVIIGHPKAATDASIQLTGKFIDKMLTEGNEFHKIEEVLSL